ncbi:MAG: ABC transporter ATP-binding protein [Actinomycetota bacterium]|nr:ABC transporter ATP-binding protein [Actinomycetota bacterium]
MTLSVEEGELLALVGPSGSGKTTILRMIAGLEQPSEGTIRMGGRDAGELGVRDRDVAMVFQEDVLFPFLTAGDNLGFSLRIRKVPDEEVDRRVGAEARVLHVDQLLGRMPDTLSAGHRQAVASARAMVRVPKVFLMDEPLARLDPRQRLRTRREIALLHKGYGTTTIYVTNDPADAMALGDRVAVIDGGALQQAGTPQEVYRRPGNLFVAGFVGAPAMNLLPASVDREPNGLFLTIGGQQLRLRPPAAEAYVGQRVVAGIRPEDLAAQADQPHHQSVSVQVGHVEYLGSHALAHGILAPRVELVARLSAPPPVGQPLKLAVPMHKVHLFDPDTGSVIVHSL